MKEKRDNKQLSKDKESIVDRIKTRLKRNKHNFERSNRNEVEGKEEDCLDVNSLSNGFLSDLRDCLDVDEGKVEGKEEDCLDVNSLSIDLLSDLRDCPEKSNLDAASQQPEELENVKRTKLPISRLTRSLPSSITKHPSHVTEQSLNSVGSSSRKTSCCRVYSKLTRSTDISQLPQTGRIVLPFGDSDFASNSKKPTESDTYLANKDGKGIFLVEPKPIPMLPIDWGEEAKRLSDKEVQKVKNQIAKYKKYPLKFVQTELGIPVTVWRADRPPTSWFNSPNRQYPLWSKQREIVEAMVKYRRVAVKSCHGPGKTYVAAIITLYLAYVWKALGITTAPTGRQVRRLLWGEIHDIWNRANTYQVSKGMPGLGGKLLQTSLELGDKWFVEGFSTDRGEFNIPGFHEETVFVVMDEACGVKPMVYDLLETILSSANTFVLYIGNPTDSTSEFKRCFDPNSDFYPISIHAKDTPNVRHKTTIYPKMTAWDWPDKMALKWGKTSPLYISRIEAEFPKTTIDGLIPAGDLLAALERDLPEDMPLAIGGDIARFGGDRIVVGLRWKSGKYRELENFDKSRLTKTAGIIMLHQRGYANQRPQLAGLGGGVAPRNPSGFQKLETWTSNQEEKSEVGQNPNNTTEVDSDPKNTESKNEFMNHPVVNIDDIGVGGGVTDMLVEEGIPTNGINVSEAPNEDESLGEDQRIQFFDKRAFYFWKLKQAFLDGKVDIDDEELAEELNHIKTEITSRGKIRIIEKDKIRKTLKRSPDKAEAMMLAWSEDFAEDNRDMVRFL